jgi:tRNA-intron endonuclease
MAPVGELLKDSVVVWDIDGARKLFREGFYGKPLGIPKPKDANFDSPLVLSVIEALYLMEQGLLKVVKSGSEVSFEELFEIGRSGEEGFTNKYLVYRDLRRRGFIVAPGLKFGSDFAVYKHGPGIDHAPFIIQVKDLSSKISALELVRSGRLATSVRKHFTIAVPQSSEKIVYALFEWWKA